MTHTQPVIYLPHGGGPCFFMEWDPPGAWASLEHWLRDFKNTLPVTPEAILVVSAHWEEAEFTLTGHPQPSLIYDYYGFPPHTYELQYPAPGNPVLAQNMARLLKKAGIPAKLDASRGFDHGVFIPLLLMFPAANIPVVQLSLKAGLDPEAHIAAGRAIASLREQNILIIGSGMSYHNLRRFGSQGAHDAEAFDEWLTKTVTQDAGSRNKALAEWEKAPAARPAHPREEHLIPLMLAAGAGGGDAGRRTFFDRIMGMPISAYQFGSA